MSGAEIVALTSVVVTGIAAPWISSFMARRQAELQTRRAREDELRLVLENAGVQLTEAITVVGRVGSNLSSIGQPQLNAVQAEIDQLWKNDDRVRVRLGGNSPEAQQFRRAIEKGIVPANSVFLQAGSGVKDPRAPQAWYKAQQVALDAQSDFYEAASRRIGPGELKPPDKGRFALGKTTKQGQLKPPKR